MFESFSVSIESSVRLYWAKPPEVSTSGGFFLPSGVSPSFLWSGQRKEAKETPQPQAGRTHRACFVLPPSLWSVVALLGALLYASRWRTHARSIGRLWGRKAPQSWGYHSTPESSLRGAFFCGRKPPPTPKETASYQSTANYIVVIE